MATLYVRSCDLKDTLSTKEVAEYWRFILNDVVPALEKLDGTRSVKAYSGAGALSADILILWEMDDASVYERALLDSEVRQLLGGVYDSWDLSSATQEFRREITTELVSALSGGK